jgi:cytochrome c oxidase subunit 6a
MLLLHLVRLQSLNLELRAVHEEQASRKSGWPYRHARLTAVLDLWRKLSIYVVIPALCIGAVNAWRLWDEHWEHKSHEPPVEERTEYPFMNIRTKNFFWGDGDKVRTSYTTHGMLGTKISDIGRVDTILEPKGKPPQERRRVSVRLLAGVRVYGGGDRMLVAR